MSRKCKTYEAHVDKCKVKHSLRVARHNLHSQNDDISELQYDLKISRRKVEKYRNFKRETFKLRDDLKISRRDLETSRKKNLALMNLCEQAWNANNVVFNADKHNIPECCICIEEIKQRCAMVPCGHTTVCVGCYSNIDKCPICRQDITHFVKLY